MDDIRENVQRAVQEVGSRTTSDQEAMLQELDRCIEILQQKKTKVQNGEVGPIRGQCVEYRDLRPDYAGFSDTARFTQYGPTVLQITILDYKNEGKVL